MMSKRDNLFLALTLAVISGAMLASENVAGILGGAIVALLALKEASL